jgi:hypothetical protein
VSDVVVVDANGLTDGQMSDRSEVVTGVSGRRDWTVEKRLAIMRADAGACPWPTRHCAGSQKSWACPGNL